MNKHTLYIGSVIMIITGLLTLCESAVAVGAGLMWIGMSIEGKGE